MFYNVLNYRPGFPPLPSEPGEGLGVRARGRVPRWRPGVMAMSQIPAKWWAARGRRSAPPLLSPTDRVPEKRVAGWGVRA
jgi:hypothetical protein